MSTAELISQLGGATWVDLSAPVSNEHPSYPYSMQFRRTEWTRFSGLWPYYTCWWAIDEHTGTHFDSPSHFVPPPDSGFEFADDAGTVTAEQVPLGQFRGPARVIDVRSLLHQAPAGVSPLVTPEHITEHEQAHGPIEPGDVVLLWTGWDRFWQRGEAGDGYFLRVFDGSSPGWTSPSVEATELLHERGVRALGTDGASIGSVDDAARTHVAGLRHRMTYVENLINLESVPAVGAYFVFMPVLVEGGSGGPGRAVAIVDGDDA